MNTWVLNFANSIVGVGILAVPFCFHICGITMAVLMILATNVLTRKTCEYLLKSGHLTRKSGYESIAQHHFGAIGKLITELGIIGLMLGTLISFQVVIGDLAPALVSSTLGIVQTGSLRTFLMCLSSLGVVPLALMRNISSLANMNAMSMGFYSIFVLVVIFMSLKHLTSGLWSMHVNFWRPEGFFHCLPIISLSFSCQSQVLIMYEAIPEQSINVMMDIIDKAIHLVTVMYLSVGFFGYVAFYEDGIRGDILANFSSGLLANTIKTGFWISIVISFPLIIFPLRLSLNSLLFTKNEKGQQVVSSAADYIPQDRFTGMTLVIITGTLIIGILIPHIETVLSITGAIVGTFLCFVFPSALYIMSVNKDNKTRTVAKVIFIISVICMVASTLAVLSANDTHATSEHKEHPGHEKNPLEMQLPVEPITFASIEKGGGRGVGDNGGTAGDGNTDNKKSNTGLNVKSVEDSVVAVKEKGEKSVQTHAEDSKTDAAVKRKEQEKKDSKEKENAVVVAHNDPDKTDAPVPVIAALGVEKEVESMDTAKEGAIDGKTRLRDKKDTSGNPQDVKKDDKFKSREIKALNESSNGDSNAQDTTATMKADHVSNEQLSTVVTARKNDTELKKDVNMILATRQDSRNNL